MDSHKNRMGEIAFWAIPHPESEEYKKLSETMKNGRENPKFKEHFKKIFNIATSLIEVQGKNGAGLPADIQLREYNLEYNGRVIQHSLHHMPMSFNVVEAFNKYIPKTSTFEIRKENDHLFSFNHFIDWITGSYSSKPGYGLENIKDGEIFSYNSTTNPSSLLFRCENSFEFGFSSCSLIKIGNEVSILLIAGQKIDLDEKTRELKEILQNGFTPIPGKSKLEVSKEHEIRALPLNDESNLWKTLVLLRFDIKTETIDARYILHDCGNNYSVISDDISGFVDDNGKFLLDNLEVSFKKSQEEIKNYSTLIELCKTCLLLPAFFDFHEDDIYIERHKTDFKEFRSLLKNKKTIENVNPIHHKSFREVLALKEPDKKFADKSEFLAPSFKIEESGFWKKLPITSQGQDKNGMPIHGRTWVTQTNSWSENSSAEDNIISIRSTEKTITGNNPGSIYLMRSAAHAIDIFKIGLTTRSSEERSGELSRSTSAPDKFLIAASWNTSDCVLAEKLIHEALSMYRINPRREFFKAPYSLLMETINSVLSSIDPK